MQTLPPLELLERTHQFPTEYMFKVIGKPDRGFLARAVAVVREELAIATDPPYHSREAVGGRHISVTLNPIVDRPEQVLAIYRRLSTLEGLVLLW